MPLDIQAADLFTVGVLIVLEGLLSADNALVMAVMVMGLPADLHRRTLRYGLVGAFLFRIGATLIATTLIRIAVVKLIGGAYLLYLTASYFRTRRKDEGEPSPPAAKRLFGLSPFWSTVLRVEVVNLAFSVDSILAAVAMSRKLWVVLAGGLLGIVALRAVVAHLIGLIQRYPSLVQGAFVIIGWVGLKLLSEYAHQMGWIAWEIPRSFSLGFIVVIFVASYAMARQASPRPPAH